MALNFYGADGSHGTVAILNGATTVAGTGTGWLTNAAVPTAGGYCIKAPDGQVYGIESCSGDGALVLCEDYRGADITGGSYYIIPVEEATVRLIEQVSSLLNSGTFAQLAGLAGSSGSFIQYIADTWTVRTPLQTLAYLLNSIAEVDVASASTANIGTATSPKVQITGTTTITGLGTTPNAIRYVRFGGALTLTHNATSLILPKGGNIQTAAGDTAIFLSDASGNWRCWDYQPCGGVVLAAASSVSVPADGSGHPITSITLGAGRWRLSADIFYNGGNTDYFKARISDTSGDFGSGDPSVGSNAFPIATIGYGAGAITGYDVSLSASTTYYLNVNVVTSTASVSGRLRAERII